MSECVCVYVCAYPEVCYYSHYFMYKYVHSTSYIILSVLSNLLVLPLRIKICLFERVPVCYLSWLNYLLTHRDKYRPWMYEIVCVLHKL